MTPPALLTLECNSFYTHQIQLCNKHPHLKTDPKYCNFSHYHFYCLLRVKEKELKFNEYFFKFKQTQIFFWILPQNLKMFFVVFPAHLAEGPASLWHVETSICPSAVN